MGRARVYSGTGSGFGLRTVTGSVDTFNITGLSPQTDYCYYIRDSCATNGFSPWVGPICFNTQCLPSSMPFYESLDNWTLACWDYYQGNADWVKYTGTGGDNYAQADFWNNGTGIYHLTSPPITITQDAQLRFFWSRLGSTFYNDRLHVRAQVAGSGVWDTILTLQGSDFDDPTASNTAPGSFVEEDILLNPNLYTGNDIIIEFVGISDFGPNVCLNDIYVENAPACTNPLSLDAKNLADTSATLNWVNTAGNSMDEVWFRPQGFCQGTQTTAGVQTSVSADSLVVDTLSANTCYEFLVRSFCSTNDTSTWSGPYQFCTPCAPYSAPYIENFDAMATGQAPDCFTPILIGTNAQLSAAEVYSFGTPRSAPNHIRFYNYDNSTTMLVTPGFSDISVGDKQVVMYARETFADGEELIIGTVPSPQSNQPFSPLDTFVMSTTDQKVISNITTANGYNGTDQYVAILHGNTGTFNTIYIDDFAYQVMPSCPQPLSGFTINAATTTATLGFSSGGSSNHQIDYGAPGFTPSGASTNLVNVTSTSPTLTGLSSNTAYEWYVRDSCGVGDVSVWTGPFSFQTACTAFTAPFSEDFENLTLGFYEGQDDCWTLETRWLKHRATSGYGWELRNTSQTSSRYVHRS
ncbi:MAG: hypothetical protein U5L96_03055 [Owenweeksia sp.]|nr:hypothetical protein [Owenweeksia sp.]